MKQTANKSRGISGSQGSQGAPSADQKGLAHASRKTSCPLLLPTLNRMVLALLKASAGRLARSIASTNPADRREWSNAASQGQPPARCRRTAGDLIALSSNDIR
jgi:hypothetical protein